MNPSRSRKGGFTLLEILVVLAIAAFMASLALGAFSSFQGSQRRSTCQSNLVQIYRACRLYANDNDYYPPLLTNAAGKVGGLTLLWASTEQSAGGPIMRPPLDSSVSYLKSATPLHCPADIDYANTSSPNPTVQDPTQGLIVDPKYLSYQKLDDPDGAGPLPTEFTYNDVRTKVAKGDIVTQEFARQLRHRVIVPPNPPVPANEVEASIPTPSNTVITWCQFHRGLSSKPDNVLFYDGSVRRMEVTQSAGCLPNRPATTGSGRISECNPNAVSSNEGAALAR